MRQLELFVLVFALQQHLPTAEVLSVERFSPAKGSFTCPRERSICCAKCTGDCRVEYDEGTWSRGVAMNGSDSCIPQKSLVSHANITYDEDDGSDSWVECDDDCCRITDEIRECQSHADEGMEAVSNESEDGAFPAESEPRQAYSPGSFTCPRAGLSCCAKCGDSGEGCLEEMRDDFSEQSTNKSQRVDGCIVALLDGATITFQNSPNSTWIECDAGCVPCVPAEGVVCQTEVSDWSSSGSGAARTLWGAAGWVLASFGNFVVNEICGN